MTKKRAYQQVLAVAVLTAMGTTGAWAADVQTGYTPQNTNTVDAAASNDDSTLAAIMAARKGVVDPKFEAEQAVKEARAKKLDNSSLATKDAAVLQVTRVQGDNLQEKQAEGMGEAVDEVQAKYYTAVTDQSLAPYVGKTITGFTIDGVPAADQAHYKAMLSEKIGDALTDAGVRADITALGGTGIFSEVNPIITVVPEGVKVAYKVTMNPIVKKVDVVGNTVYPTDMLVKYMNVTPDTVLNTVSVGERLQGINAAYARDGYILAHVKDVQVLPNGTLMVYIQEGIVEGVTVHGNTKTKPYVITREMVQKVGKPFNKFLVRRSIEKIYNLGFFDDVNVRLLPGTNPDDVVVEVDVLEHKTGTITLGAGYSDSDGMVGVVEVGEDNLRGTGDKVKLHWEFGGSAGYKNYSVSYLRPWIDKKGTSLGVSIFNNQFVQNDYDTKGNSIAKYEKKSKGFNVSLGRQTGEFSRDYVTIETRNEKYDTNDSKNRGGFNYNANSGRGEWWNNGDINFADHNYVKNNFGRTNSVTWQRVFDSRDNIYNPTRGKRLATTFQWAGHGLGGDFNFFKLNSEFRTYKNLGHDHVLAFRGRVGYSKGTVPAGQLFALGGADTLRGYEDDQFRGMKMYALTGEYRFPIWKKISGVVFTDVGAAWDAPNLVWYHDNSKFNASVGAGVRVVTPIGPIRLDYGIGKHQHKFHFSFGGQF